MRKDPDRGQALLYDRAYVSQLLGVSIATLLRLEARKALTPIKLNSSTSRAKTYYRASQVRALAGLANDAAA